VLTPVTLAVNTVTLCLREEKSRREHVSHNGCTASAKSEETTVNAFVHEGRLEIIPCVTPGIWPMLITQ
jgi:hypothetical protein